MTHHLLVTNDFPPKVGGIQSYLWELWRRLPSDSFTVFTTPYRGAEAFDAAQPFRVVRSRQKVLLPHPQVVHRVNTLAREVDASLVVLDPAVPLGAIGPRLERPYAVVVHGAEVTVPGRAPGSRAILSMVLRGARLVISAGGYPAAEAERAARQTLPVVNVPPGVDIERFRPLDRSEVRAARAELGLPADVFVVSAISRLVPRKGFDTVLRGVARLPRSVREDVVVAITGSGRDRRRLERLADELGVRAQFLGRVPDEQLVLAYGCADVFAMLCRVRWGGLEQEGFGIVFVEAAASGVAQLAGASGGATEAVLDGVTGFVIDPPDDAGRLARVLGELYADRDRLAGMGAAARRRAVQEFSYDVLAARLQAALGTVS